MNKELNVVDFSGYMFSGKSAYYDLVAEFEGSCAPDNEFEFSLIKVPNGILDLYYNLVLNWSPIRSSEAIRNFKQLVKLHGNPKGLLHKLFSIRTDYNKIFPTFNNASTQYLNKLIIDEWKAEWPFSYYQCLSFDIFFKKLMFKLGKKDSFETLVYLSRIDKKTFIEYTQNYLEELFNSAVTDINSKRILLVNAFETTNPVDAHSFFKSAKSIIVDRDPRDIYLSAKYHGIVNGLNIGKTAIGDNVESFINRFLLYRKNLNDNDNILRVNFEDLFNNYDETVEKVMFFLENKLVVHLKKDEIFNRKKSEKNFCMYKNITDSKLKYDIGKIEKKLESYCVNN